MSDAETPVEAVLAESPGGAGGARKAPGALIAICVILILLGALGLLTALGGIATSLYVEQVQSGFMMGPMPADGGGSQEMVDLMEEMQAKINAVAIQYRWHSLAISAIHVVIASLLLIGAVGTLRFKPRGRSLVIAGCAAAVAFEFGRSILQTYQAMQNFSIVNNYFPRIMEAATSGGGGAAPPMNFITSMMKVGMYVGVAFGLLFVLAKIIFYVFAIKYLNSPHVKPLFKTASKAA